MKVSTAFELRCSMRKPNFDNLLKVLKREIPERPTLFEFFLNDDLYEKLVKGEFQEKHDCADYGRLMMHAFKNAGYDYVTVSASDFHFRGEAKQYEKSISLNDGVSIYDRESFDKYIWNEPDDFDCTRLDLLAKELPDGMKIMVHGPGGVLENVISLVGYENLCIMIFDDPELVQEIFDGVGSRMVRYYELCASHEAVGVVMSNDDWGFKTQTMLSPSDMRKYVFPWHKKIVEAIHAAGKPAVLHSCGYLEDVMEDIIEDMKYDGKHSYEDLILPVEEAYEKYGSRIAILGGIDVNFMCQATPEKIEERSREMLKRAANRGSYALGTGNSVPYYIPDENYMAMISVIHEDLK